MYNAVKQDGVKYADVAAQFNIFGGKSAGSISCRNRSILCAYWIQTTGNGAAMRSPNHNQSGRGSYEAQKPPFTGVNIGKY